MNARQFGRGWPRGIPSSKLRVVTAARSRCSVEVHVEIAPIVRWLVDETERRGYLFDHGPKDPTDDWGYANRPIGNTQRPSFHSFALAIDWDATIYAQGQRRRRLPRWVVDLWAQYGFTNGEVWANPDPMHMEWQGTLAEARWLVASLAAHHLDGTQPPMGAGLGLDKEPTKPAKPIDTPTADVIAAALNPKEFPVEFIAQTPGGVSLVNTDGGYVVPLIDQKLDDAMVFASGAKLPRFDTTDAQLDEFRKHFKRP